VILSGNKQARICGLFYPVCKTVLLVGDVIELVGLDDLSIQH
jgi:hypothetical protein